MENARATYEEWLNKLDKDSQLYKELVEVKDEAEITDRFYQEIEFGTAGLRGICGAGTNRMNELTIGRATQGIANYIIASGNDLSRGVVIAYDCRYFSKEFSELAAEILAGNGIKAYIFPSLRPTPELSFAIRKLNTISGINMTASHNPKEYNGYKVYWEDGAQISGQVSDGMLEEIRKLDMFDTFKRMPMQEAISNGMITMLGQEMDRLYLDYVKSMAQRDDSELDLAVPVVYTPLNGAGSVPMLEAARERGFKNFTIVPEQKDPDPDFTTVPFPNPENSAAFELAEKLGQKLGAEVLIATDPDSDRMAVEVKDKDGKYIALSGNETGAMIIAYLAESKKSKGKLSQKSAMIKSIVTGNFGATICEDYGIAVFNTLTGFKNICGKIPVIAKDGYEYFFGYEESIGCAPGEAVRDKDGVAAGMIITEMAAYYRKKGMSLMDYLTSLYEKYGYFGEHPVNVILKGIEGKQRIGRIMDVFRQQKPATFGTFTVAKATDYINGHDDIPPQNLMVFEMTDGSWFAIRPSGTEPKLKYYCYTVAATKAESTTKADSLADAVQSLIDSVQ